MKSPNLVECTRGFRPVLLAFVQELHCSLVMFECAGSDGLCGLRYVTSIVTSTWCVRKVDDSVVLLYIENIYENSGTQPSSRLFISRKARKNMNIYMKVTLTVDRCGT
jgi:hypothetical protein